MKAHRETIPTPFVPVTLTLESQHEVDAIFAAVNHTDVREALGFQVPISQVLTPFRSDNYRKLHGALAAILK